MERGDLQSEGEAGLQPLRRRWCPRRRPRGSGRNGASPSTSLWALGLLPAGCALSTTYNHCRVW